MFESLLTELALAQPEDPHAFLVKGLQKMTAEELAKLKAKVKGVSGSDFNPTAPDEQKSPHVLLRLTAVEGKQQQVLDIMTSLKNQILKTAGCVEVTVFTNEENQVMAVQKWASASALERFNSSGAIAEAGLSFQGLLAGPVDYSVFTAEGNTERPEA